MIVHTAGSDGTRRKCERHKVLEKADFVERPILPRAQNTRRRRFRAKAEWTLTDFQSFQERKDLFAADAVICCLGTTIKKPGAERTLKPWI